MFEKYDVSELYFGHINIIFPDDDRWDTCVGGVLKPDVLGQCYWTVLVKKEDFFIDLRNPKLLLTKEIDPETTSYVINYIEPLSNYYSREKCSIRLLSRRQAIKEAEKCYNEHYSEIIGKISINNQEKDSVPKLIK